MSTDARPDLDKTEKLCGMAMPGEPLAPPEAVLALVNYCRRLEQERDEAEARRAETVAMCAQMRDEQADAILPTRDKATLKVVRENEALAIKLAVAESKYKLLARDLYEGMDCLPDCDSYGHDEGCPVAYPEAAFRLLRERLAAAEQRVRKLEERIAYGRAEREAIRAQLERQEPPPRG